VLRRSKPRRRRWTRGRGNPSGRGDSRVIGSDGHTVEHEPTGEYAPPRFQRARRLNDPARARGCGYALLGYSAALSQADSPPGRRVRAGGSIPGFSTRAVCRQVRPHACARHQTTRATCSTPLGHAAVVVACWFAPQGDFGVRFSGLAGEVTPRVLAKGDLRAPGTVGSDPRCTEMIPKPIPALSHCCAPHPMRLMCTRTRPEIVNVSPPSLAAWFGQGSLGGFRALTHGLEIAHLAVQPPPCMFDTRPAHTHFRFYPISLKMCHHLHIPRYAPRVTIEGSGRSHMG
jgi:hypothetical protein